MLAFANMLIFLLYADLFFKIPLCMYVCSPHCYNSGNLRGNPGKLVNYCLTSLKTQEKMLNGGISDTSIKRTRLQSGRFHKADTPAKLTRLQSGHACKADTPAKRTRLQSGHACKADTPAQRTRLHSGHACTAALIMAANSGKRLVIDIKLKYYFNDLSKFRPNFTISIFYPFLNGVNLGVNLCVAFIME